MTTAKLLTSIIFNLTIAALLALSIFVPGCAFLFSTVMAAIFILHSIEIAILALHSPCLILCLPSTCYELHCGESSFDDYLNFMIGSVRVGSVIGLGLVILFHVTLPITIPTLAIVYISSSVAFALKDMMNAVFNLILTNTNYPSSISGINPNNTYYNNMNCSFSRTNDRQFFSSSRPFFKNIDNRNNPINSHSGNPNESRQRKIHIL